MQSMPMSRLASLFLSVRHIAAVSVLGLMLPGAALAAIPTIASATYDASTGTLVVTGTDFPADAGADIDADKLTLTGEGGATHTLTDTADVEIDSATGFTLALSANDRDAINRLFNRNGTASTSGTTYNLAAAEDWARGADPIDVIADTTGNGITVSNVAVPTITSATYEASTGTLVVTGTGFLSLAGADNDINPDRLNITGVDGDSWTLTSSSDVDITSSTVFTLVLHAADKTQVDRLIDANGTVASDGTPYNLAAAEDWARGADVFVVTEDVTGNSITASNVSAPLAVTTSPGSTSFVAGDNTAPTPVAVDAGVTVTGDAPTSVTVGITGGFHAGEDVLGFANDGSTMGNITGSYNAATGVLTLTSASPAATLAQWQAALRTVTYADTAVIPDTTTRTVSFTVTNGTTDATATRTVTVTAVDQTPIVTTTGSTVDYLSSAGTVTVDDAVTVTDLDNTTLALGTVSISTGFQAGDMLGFANSNSALYGNIVASYNAATGVLTLTSSGATATLAQWSNALSSVVFASTSTVSGTRTVAFAVNDGVKTSAGATSMVELYGAPVVTSVGSTTPDGAYRTGDTIQLAVVFDRAVLVDAGGGTPELQLETGSVDRNATYQSGSGSNTLIFTYVVQADDSSADLDYASTTALGGGGIRSSGGINAVLTLPPVGGASSIAGQHDIVVDGVAPSVTTVAVPADGTYVPGQDLDFTVDYTETVMVDTAGGTPRIAITLDAGVIVHAGYVSGSGTSALVFRHTVAAGEVDPDGIVLANLLDANGGAIRDAAGNAAGDTLNGIASTSGVLIGATGQAITFGAQSAQAFVAGGTFVLDPPATASSGLPVDYSSQTPETCTIDGVTVTMLAPGTCTIAADQAGDANYDPAPTVTQSIAIDRATQAITGFATDPEAPVFEPNGTFSVSAQGGGSGNPVVFATTTGAVCSVSGDVVSMLTAGTCRLTADQAGNENYSAAPQQVLEVAIAKATPTLGWIGALEKVVGEPAFELADPDSDSDGTFSFGSSDPSVATVDGNQVTIVGPGTTTLVAVQSATRDYAEATISTTLTVAARPDPTRDAEVVGAIQAQVDASLRFVAAQQQNILGRLRQLRASRGNPAGNTLSLGYIGGGGGLALPLGGDAVGARLMPQGMWISGTITVAERDATAGSDKLRVHSDGVTVGFDHRIGDRLVLGVAGGYGWSDTDSGRESTLEGSQRSIAAYALWRGGRNLFVDGMLGTGELRFDIARWSELAGATARARRDGEQAFATLTFGYEHSGEHSALTGYGRYETSRTTLDPYSESGLGAYDLRYGEQAIDDSALAVGFEGRYHFATPAIAWRPYWLVEYRGALQSRSDVGINYVVQPVASDYVLGMRGTFADALSIGVGLELDLPRGWQLGFQLRREQSGSGSADSYGMQLKWGGASGLMPGMGVFDPIGGQDSIADWNAMGAR